MKHNLPNSEGPKLRIIIVEDEDDLRVVLLEILTRLGHDVRGAWDGASLDCAMAEYPADVVVLDLNLPGEDGVEIAQRMRRTCNCGIIMTTARWQVNDRISGFESGADLYFVKPIDPMELHAALLNLKRRLEPTVVPAWYFDSKLSVMRTPKNATISLTTHECIVMRLLFAVPGNIVPRTEVFAALGHPDDEYSYKRLDVLLSRLRSKIRTIDPEAELPVRARRGMGYAFLGNLQE